MRLVARRDGGDGAPAIGRFAPSADRRRWVIARRERDELVEPSTLTAPLDVRGGGDGRCRCAPLPLENGRGAGRRIGPDDGGVPYVPRLNPSALAPTVP